jgi:chromosome segregation ATPase
MWTTLSLWFKNAVGWISLHKKFTAIVVGLIALLLFGWWLITTLEAWYGQRQINKERQAIVNKAQEIANVQANISAMASNRDEKIGELKVLTNSYVNASNVDAKAQAEANQAVANLAKVVNSNSNVNASIDDLNRKLDQLDIK